MQKSNAIGIIKLVGKLAVGNQDIVKSKRVRETVLQEYEHRKHRVDDIRGPTTALSELTLQLHSLLDLLMNNDKNDDEFDKNKDNGREQLVFPGSKMVYKEMPAMLIFSNPNHNLLNTLNDIVPKHYNIVCK